MGLFDFLLGRSSSAIDVFPDRIWLTQQAKYQGIRRELQNWSRSDSAAILLIAHFDDTLGELETIAAETPCEMPLTVVLARALSSRAADALKSDETARIDLLVAERHPLRSVDQQLLQFAEELPCRCRIAHHLSLEDAPLKAFLGDQIKGILKSLGMKEDEAIESSMVSRRVQAAQKRIETQALSNTEARSALEWMEKNMPRGDAP